MVDFEAPQEVQYWKPDVGFGHNITVVDRLPDHEDHWLDEKKGQKAHVYLIRDSKGKEWKWTVSSKQLHKTLLQVEAHFGTYIGIPLKVTPDGDKTDRKYRISVPDETPRQVKLGAEAQPAAPSSDEPRGVLTQTKKGGKGSPA